jgi:hypothetical protein
MMSGNAGGMGSAGGMGGGTPFGSFFSGLPGFLQGMFGNSGEPYKKAGEAYLPYYNKAQGYQNPFFNSGQRGIPEYEDWVNKMKDPGGFMNNMMSQYQQSPWAKYLQQQSTRAGINAASMGGLPNGVGGAGIGSTPFLQQAQQNSANISSQDMNNWLKNAFHINDEYGAGLNNQVGWGQHAADQSSKLASDAGDYMGGAAYGQQYGQQQDQNSMWAGLAKMFGG